jgi:hypothetical protein
MTSNQLENKLKNLSLLKSFPVSYIDSIPVREIKYLLKRELGVIKPLTREEIKNFIMELKNDPSIPPYEYFLKKENENKLPPIDSNKLYDKQNRNILDILI